VRIVVFSKLDTVVHCTQLSLVLVVLTTCINTLVPPLAHSVVFVHVVTLSGFDVAVLLTVFHIVIHQIPNAATSSTALLCLLLRFLRSTAKESNKLGVDATSGEMVAGGGDKKGGGRKMPNCERGQFNFDTSTLISSWYFMWMW
jgi:hypothetical protein